MRASALGVALEETAGNRTAATGHLRAYLELFAHSDYARALVREGTIVVPVIKAYLEDHPDSPHWASAQALLDLSMAGQAIEVPKLNDRESEILVRLDTQTDRQIGANLGLSHDGVRYHIRNLFAKLMVHDRRNAVRRAQSLGLMQTDSD